MLGEMDCKYNSKFNFMYFTIKNPLLDFKYPNLYSNYIHIFFFFFLIHCRITKTLKRKKKNKKIYA